MNQVMKSAYKAKFFQVNKCQVNRGHLQESHLRLYLLAEIENEFQ